MNIEIYTDGSATTKDKPGGWAWVLVVDGEKHSEGSGYLSHATNNDAELEAAIQGLIALKGFIDTPCSPEEFIKAQPLIKTLVSDSEIVLGWITGAYRFRQLDKIDKFKELQLLVKLLEVKTRWIEGHTGHIYNERCDQLAKEARLGVAIKEEKTEMATLVTKEEFLVLEKISAAYKSFCELEQQHPDDIRDFVNGVHIMQGLIMQRVCRRVDPKKFPSYETEVKHI